MYRVILFLVAFSLYYTAAFDVKLKYCRFRKSEESETNVEKLLSNCAPPTAYYWRDYHGVIPPDAYPLGSPDQYPQTYIGLVYDPSNNGTFATTIVEGLDYVYNVNQRNIIKIHKHIQILCTQSPRNFAWFTLNKDNFSNYTQQGYKIVKAAFHDSIMDGQYKTTAHFIAKTNVCKVVYVGNMASFNGMLELALMDGSYRTSYDYLWLMYKEMNPSDYDEKTGSSRKLVSHISEYKVRPDSIIPKFYKKLTIGPFSATCTNEAKTNVYKFNKNLKLLSSMAYFWQPIGLINDDEIMPIGRDSNSSILYIGQASLPRMNLVDLGPFNKNTVSINLENSDHETKFYYHVLSSNHKELFKWVNTTSEDFAKLDRDAMIPGGAHSNGTETYVCRFVEDNYPMIYPGSGRVQPGGTYCYVSFGPTVAFQVLMFKMNY